MMREGIMCEEVYEGVVGCGKVWWGVTESKSCSAQPLHSYNWMFELYRYPHPWIVLRPPGSKIAH